MTDKKQDLRAELMQQIDRYARRLSIDDFDTLRTIRTGIEANTRALTDRIAELEAQLEAVGAGGGVTADA